MDPDATGNDLSDEEVDAMIAATMQAAQSGDAENKPNRRARRQFAVGGRYSPTDRRIWDRIAKKGKLR